MLDTSKKSARRHFLKRVALTTAGASVAGMFPNVSPAAAEESAEELAETCKSLRIPMREVDGKVAFITGGSSGIGLGITRAFADAGMKVAIGYRTKKHIEEAMTFLGNAKGRVHAINVDVTDRLGMQKAAAETAKVFGKIHVLVNNAGVLYTEPLSKTKYEDWDWVLNVNLTGVFNGVHSFLPYILEHGEGGQIISTSSMDGLVAINGHHPSYVASKFAVVGMSESLRATLSESNVGVSVYCPGGVKSRVLDSNRNRPVSQKSEGRNGGSERTIAVQKGGTNSDILLDPIEAGQLVLRGMQTNALYILSHPEYEGAVRGRNEVIVRAFPTDRHPTIAQIEAVRSSQQRSIYTNERDRMSCFPLKRAK